MYRELVENLISSCDEAYRTRLTDAFRELTPPELELNNKRKSRVQFSQNFDLFLLNVRGFLCVK